MAKIIHLPLILLCCFGFLSASAADGPGLPNQSHSAAFKILSVLESRGDQGHAHFHNGYLLIPRSKGFDLFDISNLEKPKKVGFGNTDTGREGHMIGFSNSYPGSYVVTHATNGVHFWDVTDAANPKVIGFINLVPGGGDYTNTVWWAVWQAPYVYAGGADKGIHIVDASDPTKPKLVRTVPISETGGFRVGSLNVVGNLMVAAAMGIGSTGLSLLDISDPIKPQLMAVRTDKQPYTAMLNGGKIFIAERRVGLVAYDISDPLQITPIRTANHGTAGGYLSYQDGFVHFGGSEGYYKVDTRSASTYTLAGSITGFVAKGMDLDMVSVMGNLAFIGGDHGTPTHIVAHSKVPDKTPPEVNMVSPSANAAMQALTSRVGLTFTDQIDLRTVNASTFSVKAVGSGSAPLTGKYSGANNILNFWPDSPLKPNTTYEVTVKAGGIKDVVGNAVATPFRSRFSTGTKVEGLPTTSLQVSVRAMSRPSGPGKESLFLQGDFQVVAPGLFDISGRALAP